jgi:tetratricopeptide (TPR) repeat protein
LVADWTAQNTATSPMLQRIGHLMRPLILILTLFISTVSNGQSNLEEHLSKAFCNCFSNQKTPSIVHVQNCFFKASQENQDSLFTAIKSQYGEISKETINKFSQGLLSKMSVSLVNDCNAYYKFMDTSRNSIYRDINKDSVKKSIQRMNTMNSENRDKSFFIERGERYFEISDLRRALTDFNSALQLDSNSVLANYFKALVLERNGNYEEAYNICNKLTLLSNNLKYKILAAIVKRKKDGL